MVAQEQKYIGRVIKLINKLKKFKRIAEKCWSRETSAYPELWELKNSAFGQCAITSIAFCYFFGGELVSGTTEDGYSHYWNKIKGIEIDLTKSQFEKRPKMENKSFFNIPIQIIEEMKERKYGQYYSDLEKRLNIFFKELEKYIN